MRRGLRQHQQQRIPLRQLQQRLPEWQLLERQLYSGSDRQHAGRLVHGERFDHGR
jgi:hypothetical protein